MAAPAQELPKITPEQLGSYKVVEAFQKILRRQLDEQPRTATELDSRRTLAADDYFSLVLFGLFNPVVRTLRGVSAASRLKIVRRKVCRQAVSLGSFSAGQHQFGPEALLKVLQSCASQAAAHFAVAPELKKHLQELHAHDSTVIRALPRMAWAVWMDEQNRGVRVHMDFAVLRQVPDDVFIAPAGVCERKAWKPRLKKDHFYVADRYFGHEYKLLSLIDRLGSRFAFRLHNNAVFTPVAGSERALTQADQDAGVVWDGLVQLGRKGPQQFRLVRVQIDDKQLDLITNDQSITAELIALIYRYRWQVELYFRWLKCILGCEHWLAESPQGVAIQVYCALIASVLLALWSGRRPNKRAMEALRFYQLGMADEDELELLLHRAKFN
jgi:hypothetical protein